MRNTDTMAKFLLWYKDVFGFTGLGASTLYNKQLLKNKQTLTKISNGVINSICFSIRHDPSKPIAKISVAWLKFGIFWIKHQYRTTHEIGVLVKMILNMILTLKEQKWLEDDWLASNKEPKYTAITLDLALATKVLDKTRTILTHMRGVTGVPLDYVIRHQLKPVFEDDDPHFGEPKTKYTSIDQELIA